MENGGEECRFGGEKKFAALERKMQAIFQHLTILVERNESLTQGTMMIDQLSGSNINPLHREAPFVELRLMEEWEIINTFERIFDSKDVSNKVKVKSISMELKRRASDWWELVGTDQGYP